MFKNIQFILHKPQLSENIGACARAMKNFNFSKLTVINPKPIYPNDKIIATSVGAKDIIKKSKSYQSLEPVIKNVDCLISTTARFRNKNIKHIQLNELKNIDFRKKIGFLFGSEASGLSNNEISYSNFVLQIPTNKKFKSLNLSHSLIIVAHTVFEILNLKKIVILNQRKLSQLQKKIYKIWQTFVLSILMI
tara:strand:- start:17 stop:592 length:576 start_codon:yes stop_codon:yes gene_type:complete